MTGTEDRASGKRIVLLPYTGDSEIPYHRGGAPRPAYRYSMCLMVVCSGEQTESHSMWSASL